jgi:hypothetical protein
LFQKSKSIVVNDLLAVDKAGQPTKGRCTVTEAEDVLDASLPITVHKEVRVNDVRWIVNCGENLRFSCDSNSIVSASMKELKPSELAMLRRFMTGSGWQYPDPGRVGCLLPARQVAIGERWEPSESEIRKWLNVSGNAKMRVDTAILSLKSVEGGVATVTGEIDGILLPSDANFGSAVSRRVTIRIDLATGRCLEISHRTEKAASAQGVLGGLLNETMRFDYAAAGSATPSTIESDLNRLGWLPYGKDENNYKNDRAGISLNIPGDFSPLDCSPGSLICLFHNKKGMRISISILEALAPLDHGDAREKIGESAGSVGAKIGNWEVITLPGGIPGGSMTFSDPRGRVVGVGTYAIDNTRVVLALVGMPSDEPECVPESKNIAKSLRVYAKNTSAGGLAED